MRGKEQGAVGGAAPQRNGDKTAPSPLGQAAEGSGRTTLPDHLSVPTPLAQEGEQDQLELTPGNLVNGLAKSRGTSDHRPMRSSGGTLLNTPKPMHFSLDSTSPRPVRQTSVLIYFCHKSDWHGFLLPAKEYKCRGSRSYYDKRGAFMKLSHSKNCSGGG